MKQKKKKTPKISAAQKRKFDHMPMITEGVDPKKVTDLPSVKKAFMHMVNNVFTVGAGKRGNELKTFTGPTLEVLGEMAIQMCCDALHIPNYKINGEYLTHPDLDDMRLDEHLWVNNELILMQEDRAWVDKPFANMKYQVAQDLFTLPYNTTNSISSELVIPVLCYSYDVTQRTFATRDYVFKKTLEAEGISAYNKFGDYRLQLFNISGQRRDTYGDYFYRGYSTEECDKYITFIYTYIKNYKDDRNL